MQNPIPKFRQSSIISEKPGYLFEKLKTPTPSWAPTTIEFNIFSAICTRFLLNNAYKRMLGNFFIFFRS